MLLVTIDAAGHQLAPGPAASLARMATARGRGIDITSAYRDPTEQARLRRLWEAGLWPAFVAKPEDSDHVKARAIDVDDDDDPAVWLWLALHALEHGWVRTDARERWHYVYMAELDRHRTAGPAPSPAPAPPAAAAADPFHQEDEMDRLIEALFESLLGRSAGRSEVNSWLLTVAGDGLTGAQLAARFPGARAEAATVVKAFGDYLGRTPSQAEIDAWLSPGPTIAEVRAGVGGSPEATARR